MGVRSRGGQWGSGVGGGQWGSGVGVDSGGQECTLYAHNPRFTI